MVCECSMFRRTGSSLAFKGGGHLSGVSCTWYSFSSFFIISMTLGFCGGLVIPRGAVPAYCATEASGEMLEWNQSSMVHACGGIAGSAGGSADELASNFSL